MSSSSKESSLLNIVERIQIQLHLLQIDLNVYINTFQHTNMLKTKTLTVDYCINFSEIY